MPSMRRRAFLKTSGGLLFLSAIATQSADAPSRRIKVGILGTAYSHFAEKYKLLSRSPDWELVGVCEDDSAVRARGPSDAQWLSAEELFARTEVVVVESAVPDHSRDALRALRAGKHVHVEKPPSLALREFKTILAAADEKKRRLQVGYQWRYHPGFIAIHEMVRNGVLGEVFQVRGNMHTQLEPERRGEWAIFKGGSLFEQGSHLIDQMVRLLGKPRSVKSSLTHRGTAADTLKDNNVVTFEFDRALGVITNSIWQPHANAHRAFEVLGTNGTAVLRPIEPPELLLDLAKAAGPYKAGTQNVSLSVYQRYVGDFAELAAAVRGERALSVSPDEELLVHEWLLRASEMI
jgi:predicted dehydrogenase